MAVHDEQAAGLVYFLLRFDCGGGDAGRGRSSATPKPIISAIFKKL